MCSRPKLRPAALPLLLLLNGLGCGATLAAGQSLLSERVAVSTVAGVASQSGSSDGIASSATFNSPISVAMNSVGDFAVVVRRYLSPSPFPVATALLLIHCCPPIRRMKRIISSALCFSPRAQSRRSQGAGALQESPMGWEATLRLTLQWVSPSPRVAPWLSW